MHMKTEELLVMVVALITAIFSYYIIQRKHEALLTEAVVSLMNDGWCHKAIPGQAFHLNLRRITI